MWTGLTLQVEVGNKIFAVRSSIELVIPDAILTIVKLQVCNRHGHSPGQS